MNKGLEIRAKKLKRKAKKRNTVKEKQIGLCRFIEFRNPRTQRVNGRYQFVGFQTVTGLQIENKLYYVENDKEKYVFMNKPQAKVLVIYNESEIHNFHPILLGRYNEINCKKEYETGNLIKDD